MRNLTKEDFRMKREKKDDPIGGGERGIRTLDTFPYTYFPGMLLQPLGHLSGFTIVTSCKRHKRYPNHGKWFILPDLNRCKGDNHE